MGQYMLERGSKGAERLQLLSRILSPTTEALLLRAGLAPGWRCLDIGCGTGQVTILMAHRTSPDGLAVGLDPDEHFLDLGARSRHDWALARSFVRAPWTTFTLKPATTWSMPDSSCRTCRNRLR